MNLFFNPRPSVSELQNLISEYKNSSPVHNIVLDYDGEVLIDPDLKQPEVDLNKFKFRIQLPEFRKDLKRGSQQLKNLLDKLVQNWNNGFIDFFGSLAN